MVSVQPFENKLFRLVRVRRKNSMKIRVYILFVFAVSLFQFPVYADQLSWNSREECEKAVKKLSKGSIVISYCSFCNDEYVEIWQVQKAVVTYTGRKEFYKVEIFYKKLFRSKKAFDVGKYKEPVEYEKVFAQKDDKSDLYDRSGVDLAYIYTKETENVFSCLGKQLSFECEVKVDKIQLPQKVMDEIQKRK
jgi:hypothetical protein